MTQPRFIIFALVLFLLSGCTRVAEMHIDIYPENIGDEEAIDQVFLRMFNSEDYSIASDNTGYPSLKNGWVDAGKYSLLVLHNKDESVQTGIAIKVFSKNKIKCIIFEFGNGGHFTPIGNEWAATTLGILKRHLGSENVRVTKQAKVKGPNS
ncbi:MAG: hypothetical protein KUG82_05355 [Pseudomonadales bacterium]|nr:hypothetical protein [Pseudomonadales bacterium]